MQPEQVKAIFTAYYRPDENWPSEPALEAFYAHVAPDFVFHRAPFPDVVGIEANRQADLAMGQAFTQQRTTVHEFMIAGDRVALRYTWQALHSGVSPNLAIPPTLKTIQIDGCCLIHFKNDQIVEWWDYSDMLGLLTQIGVIPAMA
jgi:predicted ester cyclase